MSKASNRIRIALQKSGRLSEESFNLLARCGIKIKRNNGQLFCHSENFPLDLLLVRDDDIPSLLMDGDCDLGIVGANVLAEKLAANNNNASKPIEEILKLNFGQCRLSIAVPETFTYTDIKSLAEKRIATTYPFLLKKFLSAHNVKAKIVELTGSVEIAPRLDIAEAICDLVSTGATLEVNGLKEVETIFNSQAWLVKSAQPMQSEKLEIFAAFKRRLDSVLEAVEAKYVMLHAPKSALQSIVNLLPGAENPTIMTLEGNPDLVAVHAVCKESVFWETLEKLKSAGASSILILPIEKMMA